MVEAAVPVQAITGYPYEGTEGSVQRYDPHNGVFRRRNWDEDSLFYGMSYAGIRHEAFPHPTATEKMCYPFDYACHVTLRAILDDHLAAIRNSTLRALTPGFSEVAELPGDLVGLSEHRRDTVRLTLCVERPHS